MKKKLLVVVILSFIISLVSEGILWYLTPAKAVGVQLPEDAELMYPAMEYYTSGYDFVGSSYIPNNEDPQFGFILPGKEIENIIIYFENPLEEDTPINTYYAVNQEALSEAKIAKQSFEKGTDVAVIQLPHDVYTHIRLDIERSFSLREIYLCKTQAITQYQKSSYNVLRVAIIWFLLFIAICLLVYNPFVKQGLCESLEKPIGRVKQYALSIKTKQFMLLLIVCIVVSTFLELLIGFAQPKMLKSELENGKSILSDESEISVVDYERDGTYYRHLSSDPQIYINNINQRVQSIEIQFLECNTKTPSICVYYPAADGTLSEEQMEHFIYYEEEAKATVQIPDNIYQFIRLDINADFELSDIKISSDPLKKISVKKAPMEIFSTTRVFIIFSFVFILGFFCVNRNIKVGGIIWATFVRYIKKKTLFCCVYAGFFLFVANVFDVHLYKLIFVFALLIITHIFIAERNSIGKKPENLFIIICMLVGLVLTISLPKNFLVSWDDEAHFPRAVAVSYFGTPCFTNAEINLGRYPVNFDEAIIEQQTQSLDAAYVEGAVSDSMDRSDIDGYHKLSYLPNAAGLFLGRLLHLPFHLVFLFGRISGLIFYAITVFFAIKITPVGKIIMLVIALFPTSVFLASNYSYDPWLTALTMLWIAMLLEECSRKEEPLTLKKLILMLFIYWLACAAKAIYCILGLSFFLLPKEKFASKSDRRRFLIFIFAVFLLIVFTFIYPFAFSTGSYNDLRGGAGVNASQQIKFIFENPFSYTVILLKHLYNYLSLENAYNYVTLLAYLGNAEHYLAFLVLIVFVIITNRNEHDVILVDNRKNRLIIFGTLFCAVCLISTALYISFTPVASPVIAGVQARYLTPLLFPFFVFIGTGKIQTRFNVNTYNLVVSSASGLLLFTAIWDCCISKYI